jgi:hypothetical protein
LNTHFKHCAELGVRQEFGVMAFTAISFPLLSLVSRVLEGAGDVFVGLFLLIAVPTVLEPINTTVARFSAIRKERAPDTIADVRRFGLVLAAVVLLGYIGLVLAQGLVALGHFRFLWLDGAVVVLVLWAVVAADEGSGGKT